MNTDNTRTHTDIKSNGGINRFFPPLLRPYACLARFDRPIGTWLLLLPGWWAITLSAGGLFSFNSHSVNFNHHDVNLMALFGIGALVMRGAGCVINDLWDRRLDHQVERTRSRPLASGAVTPKQAFVFLILLLSIGLLILTRMSFVTILLGVISVPFIVFYPLMKRITWWPQLFLGLTFNFGALMGWSAVTGTLALPALFLYAGGIFWTLGYDTIYAHQDKEDDARIGIKSTALKLGENSKKWVAGFYSIAWLFFVLAYIIAGAGTLSVLILLAAGWQFFWQVRMWDMDNPESSLMIFKSNRDFGLFVLAAAAF